MPFFCNTNVKKSIVNSIFPAREEPSIPLYSWPSLDNVSNEEAMAAVAEILSLPTGQQNAPRIPTPVEEPPRVKGNRKKTEEEEEECEGVLTEQ